jgi:transketolase
VRAGRWAENDLAQGTYRLEDTGSDRPEVLLIASGSEVALAVEAFEQLRTEGVRASLVSMPSRELFEQRSQEYRDNVLPPEVKARVVIEQASTLDERIPIGPPLAQDHPWRGYKSDNSFSAEPQLTGAISQGTA